VIKIELNLAPAEVMCTLDSTESAKVIKARIGEAALGFAQRT
jgi:hypothetical protein